MWRVFGSDLSHCSHLSEKKQCLLGSVFKRLIWSKSSWQPAVIGVLWRPLWLNEQPRPSVWRDKVGFCFHLHTWAFFLQITQSHMWGNGDIFSVCATKIKKKGKERTKKMFPTETHVHLSFHWADELSIIFRWDFLCCKAHTKYDTLHPFSSEGFWVFN